MVDESEEKPGEGINLQQYVDIIRRRHMYFLIPFFLGWLVVWSASWVLPSKYKSGTLILVEQPSMPKDYVTPNITDDLQTRLASITQQILSRTRLLHIIDELNLYADKRGHLNEDELVDRDAKGYRDRAGTDDGRAYHLIQHLLSLLTILTSPNR